MSWDCSWLTLAVLAFALSRLTQSQSGEEPKPEVTVELAHETTGLRLCGRSFPFPFPSRRRMSFPRHTCLAQEQHPDLLYFRLQRSQRALRSEIVLDLRSTRITVC